MAATWAIGIVSSGFKLKIVSQTLLRSCLAPMTQRWSTGTNPSEAISTLLTTWTWSLFWSNFQAHQRSSLWSHHPYLVLILLACKARWLTQFTQYFCESSALGRRSVSLTTTLFWRARIWQLITATLTTPVTTLSLTTLLWQFFQRLLTNFEKDLILNK